MEAIFADVTISMSEFKRNPAAVLRQANCRPVAVLNHNKAAFYIKVLTVSGDVYRPAADGYRPHQIGWRFTRVAKGIELSENAVLGFNIALGFENKSYTFV